MTAFKYGVFVPVSGTVDARAVTALAEETGLSRVDARMILRSRIPRRVGSARTVAEAREKVLSLKGAGFDAFVVSHEALTRRVARRARSCRFDGKGVTFEPSGGFGPGALRLILLGEIERGTVHVTRVYRTNPYTHMGVLGQSRVEQKRTRSTETELFLHLYGDDHRNLVEIRSRSFNFICLGREKGVAGAVNLRKLGRKLRRRFPKAAFDDRLLKFTVPLEDVGGRANPGPTRNYRARRLSNEDGVRAASRLLAIQALGR